MKWRSHIPKLLGAITLLLVLFPTLTEWVSREREGNGKLIVSFLNVGQGDAIFIQSPTGKQVLIDGGPDASVLQGLASEMGFFDRTLDMVIVTHEDRDHVGGLVDVFTQYAIGTFVRSEQQGESTEARIIDDLTKLERSQVVYARRNMSFDLGASTTLTILFPDRDPSGLESNTASIIAKLAYSSTTFLFTGDAPKEIEEYLVELDPNFLDSDVLKLGHHGSRTSSLLRFLKAVSPQLAIVSAGKNNRYKHPHTEVLERLAQQHIPMQSTAEHGTIRLVSDGVSIQTLHR
jgi:competence protein ComEC